MALTRRALLNSVCTATAITALPSVASAGSRNDSFDGPPVTVCRRDFTGEPEDLLRDDKFLRVSDEVQSLLANGSRPPARVFYDSLAAAFDDVTFDPGSADYMKVWDPDKEDFIWLCVNDKTITVDASTDENPIDVVVRETMPLFT